MKPGDLGYPVPSTQAALAIMRANPPSGTRPETRVRSALQRAGLRFWKDRSISLDGLRTRPDVLFPRARVAVFIDGCFWHCCPEHGSTPKANPQYWPAKLMNNVARDRLIDDALFGSGWTVVRVWEHDAAEDVVARVAAAVAVARTGRPGVRQSLSPRARLAPGRRRSRRRAERESEQAR